MERLWLKHWRNNNWVPYCCTSCVKWEKKEDWYIKCDNWVLMKSNEYCGKDYSLDESKTPEEVIHYVQNFINKNSWI